MRWRAPLPIPRTLLGIDVPANSAFDLEIVGRRVQAMKLSTNAARRILLSGLVDAHTHIDKNYTVREVGAARGNLFDAIQRMKLHHAAWTSDAFFSRMERALTEAWRSGTRALRTHLDWPTVQAPASLQAFERLRDEWAGRIELQFVSLTSLDMFADHAASESIAREVLLSIETRTLQTSSTESSTWRKSTACRSIFMWMKDWTRQQPGYIPLQKWQSCVIFQAVWFAATHAHFLCRTKLPRMRR